MLYFAVLIPILITVWLLLYYRAAVKWWEIGIQFAVCFIVIVGCQYAVERFTISDTEYWGNLGTQVRYYEDWNEEVEYVETYQCGTSKNPKTCTRIRTRIDYHPEYWELRTDGGQCLNITGHRYAELVSRWHMQPKFKDLHRDYHSNDGDMYYANWDKQKNTAEPVITIHTYPNRTQVSSSVYNYPDVLPDDIKAYGLFDYPNVNGYQDNAILGYSDPNATKEFLWLNGYWGPKKKVRLWVLVYHNQPLQAAKLQEAYWGGANKNELVYCIGINDENAVQWAHVISWTDVQDLKIEARDFIAKMDKIDLMALAKWTDVNINRFIKKDFREFEHLEVEPPLYMVIIAYIIILIINIGVAVWVVRNDYCDYK